jgi:hypothetical protein
MRTSDNQIPFQGIHTRSIPMDFQGLQSPQSSSVINLQMCNRFCSIGFHCFPIKSQLSHQISWRSLLVPLSFHQQFDARLFGGSHQFFEVLHCIAMGEMSKRHQMDDQMFCVMFTKRGFLMFPDVYEICQTYYHDIIMLSWLTSTSLAPVPTCMEPKRGSMSWKSLMS